MSNELQDIIITIDTREQNQKRINAVERWGTANGAIVEHSKLDLCDYRILGDFRGHEINIGAEAKGLSDFCSCDYEDLKRKLFDSFEIYDEVALFIESANYSFLNEGFGKSVIINSAVHDGSANVCNLAVLEGCCSTLERNGIYVRQLRSEMQFPYSIENLLTYTTHDHSMVSRKGEMTKWEYILMYRNALSRIRGINTKKRLEKIMKAYPNFHFLASASEESLIEIMGKQIGMTIYAVLRYQGLMTAEWKNNKFLDGTDKTMCEYNKKPCDQVNAYDCVGKKCKSHPDFKNDNDKTTEVLVSPPLSSVAISNHQDTLKKSCDTDRGYSSTTPSNPLKTKIPGPVQEKDLKFASLSKSPPSPAITLTFTKDEELFGKTNPDWKVETHRMSARIQLESYLQSPHTLQECVDKFNVFTSGTIYEHIARMKKEGIIVEFDNKTLVIVK